MEKKSEQLLWSPSAKRIKESQISHFIAFINNEYQTELPDDKYQDLYQFSLNQSEKFYRSLFSFFKIDYQGELSPVNTDPSFESYGWFPRVKLSFAKNLLKNGRDEDAALSFFHESGASKNLSYSELRSQVASLQCHLKKWIQKGDVLGAYMPNTPETVISMLACQSLGGVFTSTSCDFGVEGVVDRFSQSRPRVLVAAWRYQYNGKEIDQTQNLIKIEKELKAFGLEKLILVDFMSDEADKTRELLGKFDSAVCFDDLIVDQKPLSFLELEFSHPLYIMYSSGTTGKPKCIVHSQGGTLLQHIKELGLHCDLTDKKNIFYFTTCGWMMWNWLVSSLYFGSKVILYEGSPARPSLDQFMKNLSNQRPHILGTSPKFLRALEESGYKNLDDFSELELLLSTGAPLVAEQYHYVYRALKADISLASISGGTDIIGCFMLGSPMHSVRAGKIQCRGLGMAVDCVDSKGESLIDQQGELVCRQSFPSRPLYFLNDPDHQRLKSAYFAAYPGLWHHGDFISLNQEGEVEVFGRSDATLNPGGVRIGTAEIYRQCESLDFIEDSLCIGAKNSQGDVDVLLFLVLKDNQALLSENVQEIKTRIRQKTTPRHVPREIFAVKEIPYTRSGKKVELAVTRIFNQQELTNLEALSNPDCLSEYRQIAKNRT